MYKPEDLERWNNLYGLVNPLEESFYHKTLDHFCDLAKEAHKEMKVDKRDSMDNLLAEVQKRLSPELFEYLFGGGF